MPPAISKNRDLYLFAYHSIGGALAWTMSGAFSAVFLLRAGLTPAQIFLAFAAILALRFLLRPLALYAALAIGLRRTFILGALISALQCPALVLVDGIGASLVIFVIISSVGQVFYCICYHVFFTAVSDGESRGAQVGTFQALGNFAAVAGPATGGYLLATSGPAVTFGAAFVIALLAILPLRRIAEPPISAEKPDGAYLAALAGVKLFFADGWIQVSLTTAWSIILFKALHGRYDSFGGTLSLAALTGALGGIILGRFIDKGQARSAVWINAMVLAVVIVARAATFGNAVAAVTLAIGTAMLSGLYQPSWLTAAYDEAKSAPCTFRFQFAAEAGWDAGGVCAGLLAAAFSSLDWSLATDVLLALPMMVVQAALLNRSYARRIRGGSNPRSAQRHGLAAFS